MGDERIPELAPAAGNKVKWTEHIAQAKPFLIPDDDGQAIEDLPPEKENRKIKWADTVELCEMPNRRQLGLLDESEGEDDVDYEIEIVEDDGDADFYLEIVDGEIFYVFETEDDSDDDDDDAMEESESDSDYDKPARPALQLPIESMLAPSLDGDDGDKAASAGAVFIFEDEDDEPASSAQDVLSIDSKASGKANEAAKPMELDPSDFVSRGRVELDTEKNNAQMEPAKDDMSDSFHESFHASCGSLLIGDSSDLSPPMTPEQQPKGTLETSIWASPSYKSPTPKSPAPKSPSRSPGSILKACPPSPRVKKIPKDKKKPKTVTKTYVRADTFDGEHQVFTWEKPDWTKESNLRETGLGEEVRRGGNLAAPITFPKQKKLNIESVENSNVYEDEHGNVIDKEELVRRIQEGDTSVMAFVPLPTYGGRYQRKLRFSIEGQKMRSGIDLAKPITKATVDRKRDDINLVAQPDKVLRRHVQPVQRQYSWEQPPWATTSLKSTDKGAVIKSGRKVEAPVTNIRDVKKELVSDTPEWASKKLASTSAGDAIKSGGDISKPITHIIPMKTEDDEPKPVLVKSYSSEMTPRTMTKKRVSRSKSLDLPPAFLKPPGPPLTNGREEEQHVKPGDHYGRSGDHPDPHWREGEYTGPNRREWEQIGSHRREEVQTSTSEDEQHGTSSTQD